MIALIEIQEELLPAVGVPFVLYGVYQQGSSPKLKAAYLKLAELRKDMSLQYKIIDNLQESENEQD